MELNNRLVILKDAEQIDEDIYKRILKIIAMFHTKWNIELKEENGAMLITHLCIALQRIKNSCPAERIDEELYEQIKLNKYFQTSQKALCDIQNEITMVIPKSEESFLIMHLCVLFEK